MHSGPYSDAAIRLHANIMTVDKKTEQIIAGKWHVFDGKTGKYLHDLKFPNAGWGGEISIDHDRNYYIRTSSSMRKYDPDRKPLNWADGKHDFKPVWGGHGNSNKGQTIAPNGDLYFVHHYVGHGNCHTTVSRIGTNGERKQWEYIDNRLTSGSGIAVDRHGNVYVGMAIRPMEQAYYPSIFTGRLPIDRRIAGPQPWFYYRVMYGSIVKFRPDGGEVVRDPNGPCMAANTYHFHRCDTKGAEWVHMGYSPMHNRDIEASRCNCETARFDLDGFDRLFIPDAMRFSVDVIDSNANRIMRIGGYGNMDARGPGSPCPKPEIAFAWPLVVWATDTGCYVADTVNSRVVKTTLDYAVKKEVGVR
jgi:hypothetical protein